ncbi:MAG TPA: MBL fold metallo-hydrolase [Desulfocapsa sulfexigens]|nr:MBL fold metallo-hydrolase [Desulfocapsa sulfexigens]
MFTMLLSMKKTKLNKTHEEAVMRKTFFVLSFLTMFFISISIISQVATAKQDELVKINPVKLTEQIYMLVGKGGNIGIFTGEDGTFMIDDQYAPLTEKIITAIKSIGGDHPKFLLNTHYHGDHTGGNENLGEEGTLIFSHDNVRERLAYGYYLKEFKAKQESLDPDGLPVVTFSDDMSFHINGDTVRAIHVPGAHTDGDSFIIFKSANVIHAGDIFFNGFYPFIDVLHGGSLKGMIDGVDTILSYADEKTKIIPGHGPLGDKQDLTSYRKMLWTVYEILRKLKADGKTAQEAAVAKPLADLDKEWADGLFKSDRWIEMIYSGI